MSVPHQQAVRPANSKSSARMMLAVQVLQALPRYMRVYLGRRQVAVSQQQLHYAEVCGDSFLWMLAFSA